MALAKRFRKTLGKSKKKKGDLFKPPKHKDLARIVTFESVRGAEEACKKLENMFKHASKKKKLTILRATQYAANRARAGAKNPKFSSSTKRKWREIAEIYEETSDWMQKHYP